MTTTVTVTVGPHTQTPRARWLSVSLTVLCVAWVMGWLPWLVGVTAVLGAAVVGVRWRARRQRRLSAIAARADQQHAWVLAGDPRGTYGLHCVRG